MFKQIPARICMASRSFCRKFWFISSNCFRKRIFKNITVLGRAVLKIRQYFSFPVSTSCTLQIHENKSQKKERKKERRRRRKWRNEGIFNNMKNIDKTYLGFLYFVNSLRSIKAGCGSIFQAKEPFKMVLAYVLLGCFTIFVGSLL